MSEIKVEIISTRDGSPTLRNAAGITYHSTHGAVQESRHVFLQSGFFPALEKFPESPLRIFEMGFGTGLNAFLTALESENLLRPVTYFSVEKRPLPEDIWQNLTYPKTPSQKTLFSALHTADWNTTSQVSAYFQLHKIKERLEETAVPPDLHLIYFDAFAPEDHPEAWTPDIFRKLYNALLPGGMLTTYCSKGIVRRALQEVGFKIEKLAGPPGKREIVRATKCGI